jgi:hypothetical protein
MKLTELEAVFVSNYNHVDESFHEQPQIDGAQGVMFICPKCQGHQVLVWFRNPRNAPVVPATAEPGADKGKGPSRWTASGTGLNDLTLDPSVNLDTEEARKSLKEYPNTCLWHGWVKYGDAA